jgi:hypothetical protein
MNQYRKILLESSYCATTFTRTNFSLLYGLRSFFWRGLILVHNTFFVLGFGVFGLAALTIFAFGDFWTFTAFVEALTAFALTTFGDLATFGDGFGEAGVVTFLAVTFFGETLVFLAEAALAVDFAGVLAFEGVTGDFSGVCGVFLADLGTTFGDFFTDFADLGDDLGFDGLVLSGKHYVFLGEEVAFLATSVLVVRVIIYSSEVRDRLR